MDRLKEDATPVITTTNYDLKSNMDRLKVDQKTVGQYTGLNLKSNMDRLKGDNEQRKLSKLLAFKIQYG